MPKEIIVKQYSIDEVKIDLLTIEEAKQIDKKYLACGAWYWLRSPGYTRNDAVYVNIDGDVREDGGRVYNVAVTARPCFRIEGLCVWIGEKILIKNTWCTVVLPNVALADYAICKHRFDSESNNWEMSELKAFIESDAFKAKL